MGQTVGCNVYERAVAALQKTRPIDTDRTAIGAVMAEIRGRATRSRQQHFERMLGMSALGNPRSRSVKNARLVQQHLRQIPRLLHEFATTADATLEPEARKVAVAYIQRWHALAEHEEKMHEVHVTALKNPRTKELVARL